MTIIEIIGCIFLACIGGAWLLFPFLMLSKANQIIKGQRESNILIASLRPRHDEAGRGWISTPYTKDELKQFIREDLAEPWQERPEIQKTSMADEKV